MLTLRTLVDEMGLELASGEDAAEAPVRWVHITELPDPTPLVTLDSARPGATALVGDLNKIMPKLTEAVRAKRS